MSVLPKNWQVYSAREPEREAETLKSRFRAISRRVERLTRQRRFYYAARGPALIGFAMGSLGVGVLGFSQFPPMMTLKHIAAFPNCAAARIVGLAPSRVGAPAIMTAMMPTVTA